MQIVKLKTPLSEEEFFKNAKEREPQYKAFSGIVQKYFINLGRPSEYGGIYIWDTAELLQEFKQSELAATTPTIHKAIETPPLEIDDNMFSLRE